MILEILEGIIFPEHASRTRMHTQHTHTHTHTYTHTQTNNSLPQVGGWEVGIKMGYGVVLSDASLVGFVFKSLYYLFFSCGIYVLVLFICGRS